MGIVPEKYEREIEEILRKSSFSAPRGPRPPPWWKTGFASEWQRNFATVSPSRLLTLGLVLALVGYFLREFMPTLGATVSLLALALLLGGLVLSMSRRHSQGPRTWRGQTVDGTSPVVEIWGSFKRRWRNFRQGRGWSDQR